MNAEKFCGQVCGRFFYRDYYPATAPYTLGECLTDLVSTAARTLRIGGRLVYFLPVSCRIQGLSLSGSSRRYLMTLASSNDTHPAATWRSLWALSPPARCSYHTLQRYEASCLCFAQVVPERYSEALMPSHPTLRLLYNCEQFLTDRYRCGPHDVCMPVSW